MTMTPEFNLIKQYFTAPTRHTILGIGDDAALISMGADMQLAISTDMLVMGSSGMKRKPTKILRVTNSAWNNSPPKPHAFANF